MAGMKWLDYFRHPFPSTEGFSAYRSPGLLVHLPGLGMFLLLALFLSPDGPWLFPYLLLYGFIGLYVGRDLAILAHSIPLLTLVVLIGIPFGVPRLWPVMEAWRTGLGGWFLPSSLLISTLVIGGFALYVRQCSRRE